MKKRNSFLLTLGAVALGFCFLPANANSAPGDLYVTDITGTGTTICKFTPNGTKTVFASGLVSPEGLAFDHSGNLFVAVPLSGTILKFTPGGVESTFVSGLANPLAIAFDGGGNLFANETTGPGTISKFAPDGTKSLFASGPPFLGFVFDNLGNLFGATGGPLGPRSIIKFTPDGQASTFLGSGGPAGPGMAFDTAGNFFVSLDGDIFEYFPAGGGSVFASNVNAFGLAFDNTGNLFATTSDSILKFAPDGTRSTFASGLNQPGFLAFEPVTEKLRNISARGLVGTGDNVLIGGFIVGGNALATNTVATRAIGPSLAKSGVTNPLADPVLELHNATGALVASNDNWQDAQEAQITASGLAPTDPKESAIYATLPAGSYTAVVSGVGDTTGVALVEVYSIAR